MLRPFQQNRLLSAAVLAFTAFAVIVQSPISEVFAQEAVTEATDDSSSESGEAQKEEGSDSPVVEPLDLGDLKMEADPGQEKLDEAAILRFDAKSPRELEAVERLLQSALKEGLSGENSSFAKKMLGSVLLQKGQQRIAAMGQRRGANPVAIRDETLRILEQAISNDPELVDAHLLIAKLNLLTGGDKQAVIESTTKAIEILKGDPAERSRAYALRALAWGPGEDEKRFGDLDAAIKDDSKNQDALQGRAALRLQNGDIEGAVEDMESLLSIDPTNRTVARELVRSLAELGRIDYALKSLSDALETKPSEGLYMLRATVYEMQRKDEEALDDYNRALAMQPRDPLALLSRAVVFLRKDDLKAAKQDLRAAERIDPRVARLDQAILVRSLIAAEEGRMADAINDMKTLMSRDPDNEFTQLRLANMFIQDNRPRKAIELLTAILDQDPKNVSLLRSRADAYLSVGDHKKAIEDYESAILAAGDDSESFDLPGILNNLAWVLSTSPNDDVRNGDRAVELGERAVELTEEKEPHILSTLAAAYAEQGDFEKAKEWSSKAVELGKEQGHNQIEQLEEELESYRSKKPWREKQETEENALPILSPDDLIDT